MSHAFVKYPQNHGFGGKRTLNVGCGFAKYTANNVVNIDAFDICEPDVVWDLNKTPLPFKDGEFDYIFANHVMEHLTNWWDVVNEFARILRPNGVLEIWVPDVGSDASRCFRDHVVSINHMSFFGTHGTYRMGGNAWSEANRKCHANRLKMFSRRSRLIKAWWCDYAPKPVKQWMAQHLRNVVEEDGYFLRKVTEAEHQEEELHAIAGNGNRAL